jgi:predicted homoserine dehydrogenase-like protein
MNNLIAKKLKERSAPIRVAVVGCGWFGSGMVRELCRITGMVPKVLIDKSLKKTLSTYKNVGVKKEDITEVTTPQELKNAQNNAKYIVFSDLELIKELKDIDVIYESTGDVLGGTKAALYSIEKGIDHVTVNSEMDATVGLRLADLAKEKRVVYSNSDGDQPGVLARMLDEITFQGFEPKIIGNCKEYYNPYQTPAGAKPYVPKGHEVRKICSFADGSKQSLELTVVANAFGLSILKRGMHGPRTLKRDIVKTFNQIVDLNTLKRGCIEFTMGSTEYDYGAPVFVIASRNDSCARADMLYLKKGSGPYYLFSRDYHLCYLEAASSIAEAVLLKTPTIAPKGRYIDTIAVAKKDLKPGKKLDGIGGYDCYGLVERADIVAKENLLPLGLSEFVSPKERIEKDTPLTYDMVDISDNLVTKLRRELEEIPLPKNG